MRSIGQLRQALIVCLALATLGGTAAAASRERAQPPRIHWSVRAEAGAGRLLVRGRVTPVPDRARIVLQLQRGKSWKPLAGEALQRGRFAFRAALPGALDSGRVRLLLLTGGHRVAVSAARGFHLDRSPPPSGAKPGPPASGSPTPPSPLEDPLSAASLMATVESYARFPNHLSGTAASAAVLGEFSAALGAAGLQLGEQAFTFPRFAPTAVALSAGGHAVPAAAIAPLLYSGTTGPVGVTAPLFDGSEGVFAKGAVGGKLVVVSIKYEHNSKPINLDSAIETAVEGGAAGLIAVTRGVGDYPKWEDVNARDGTGPLPVVMVGKRSGAAVIAAAEAGESGTLTLAAETSGTSCDRLAWGELEGAEPSRRVIVGVPISSFTPSASEHGTGLAIVLGLARHYAHLARAERPESLVFMAYGGHEIGWLALQALMSSPRASWFEEADAYVHLGSALGAPTAVEETNGTIVTTPVPDPTGRLHDSENPLLEHSIIEDFAAAGVPTPETQPHVASGGEQTYAYAAGIPTASFSGASLFFHTAGDLPGAVDPGILAGDAEAFRRSVDTITSIPAGRLKAENTHAAQLGSEINPALRAPVNPTKGAGGTLGSGGVGGPTATPIASCP